MKKKQPTAKYKDGDIMWCSMSNGLVTIEGEPQWNGHTYMYSFKDTDMRCGQDYLMDPEYKKA